MSVRAAKHDLAHELFMRTAHQSYIAARWCAAERLECWRCRSRIRWYRLERPVVDAT